MKRTFLNRSRIAGAGLVATFALALPALAEYPEKNITMIIPFGAGGGSDTLARTIATVIDEKDLLPVGIIPENRPGSSGAVGYSTIAQQAGNPYTIGTVSVSFFTTPLLGGSPVSWRDFTPLASIAQSPYLLVVPAATEIRSLEDLAGVGRLTTGTVGVVSDAALLSRMTANALGVQIDAVPFDGEGEVLAALLGGHVDIGYLNPSEAMSQMQAGTLRAIAISSAERSEAFPDVPTFAEQGHPEIVHTQLRGLVMPKDVPPEAVAYWEDVLEQVATSPEWKAQYIDRFHDIPDYADAKGLAEAIETTNARYEALMKELGLIN